MTDETDVREDESPDELMERLGEQEGKEGTPPKEEAPAAETKIKIGDDEFTPEELATQRQEWLRAQEIEKGGRAKFDEAAELRKAVDAKEQELSDMRTIWDAFTKGTPEVQRAILQELGGTIPGQDINEGELTENEAALKRSFDQRIKQLEGTLRQQSDMLAKVVPTLEETEKMQTDIATIKEKTGIDVSPELLANWKDNGIADPVKAALGVMLPMLQAAKPTEKAKDEIPDATKTNTFDPEDPDIDPDDMFNRLVRQGQVPSR
jgi:hypothetical protein